MEQMIEAYYHETHEGLEMKSHFHNSYEIIYVLEGEVQFKIGTKEYSAKSGNLIFISNLESHELRVLKYPYKRFFILIRPGFLHTMMNEPVLSSILKHRPQHFSHLVDLSVEYCGQIPSDAAFSRSMDDLFSLEIANRENSILGMIIKIYKECTNKTDFWELALCSNLELLLVELYRTRRESFPLKTVSKAAKTVLDIQKFIEEHCEEEISLVEIASSYYTDMYYLSHLFKKVTGFTFKEYLIRQRISRARDHLFHTNEDITEVAVSSGFNNVNHFIRIFKKFEGITPYQYRKKYRF